MLLVVDTNEILSALLSKGKSFDIFLINKSIKRFEFIAPEYLFFEIGKNLDEIVERGKLSSEELGKTFRFIRDEIDFVPFEEFNKYAEEAKEIAPHSKDLQYFALALKFGFPIWSNEEDFKKQSVVKVFSTRELKEFLSK